MGNNSAGVTGVAWSVQLLACKIYSAAAPSASTSAIVACIDYCT